ncbi:unnamed protein product [Anisakis simplex]|uniref:Transcription initiation factor IIA subunit 1 (inferred by orthology to a human protein) n=2 Tax=Spirurina TaxID=6274 RepID=A0A0M3K160_ANISI|nr:unnamed protein product [Anisakis simplex]
MSYCEDLKKIVLYNGNLGSGRGRRGVCVAVFEKYLEYSELNSEVFTKADIYKGVINDVISQVKEAFLDENVDVDVLQQLKKEWEEKLMASGSVDLEGTKPVAPPPIRQMKLPAQSSTSNATTMSSSNNSANNSNNSNSNNNNNANNNSSSNNSNSNNNNMSTATSSSSLATATTTHMIATPQTIPAGSTLRIAQGGQVSALSQGGYKVFVKLFPGVRVSFQHILVQQASAAQSAQTQLGTQPTTMVMQTTSGAGGAQQLQRPVQQVQYISASSLPITTDPNSLPQVVQLQHRNVMAAGFQRPQLGQATSQATISTIPSGMIAFQPGPGARIIQQGGQQYIMHSELFVCICGPANSVMIVNANGQQIPVTLASATMLQQGRIAAHGQLNPKIESASGVPQMDGAGFVSTEYDQQVDGVDDQPGSSGIQKMAEALRTIKIEAAAAARKGTGKRARQLVQLDGASRISDSSSDEEDVDEDDDDDPLRRIADRIGDDGTANDDDEQVVEEDPLNSGDDQSDDEDVERLFEADNVVMCQFEKVHRARSKWKFTLKDGIMHIQGKDYCFQRCSGEAEW